MRAPMHPRLLHTRQGVLLLSARQPAPMDPARPLGARVAAVAFSFYSTATVRRVSVKAITSPVVLDALGRPAPGGLYDTALCPSARGFLSASCHLGYFYCPGHFGHIDLPVAVVHPLLFSQAFALLRAACLYCHRLRIAPLELARYVAKLRLA